MSTETPAAAADADRQWFITRRWQEYDAEGRINLLRTVGIGVFYAIELANYHGVSLGPLQLPKVAGVDERFHQSITLLCMAWGLVCVGVLVCLVRRYFPPVLAYVVTAADLALLTTVLLAASGPRSPLLAAYFLVLALAALRFRLPLVWFSTLGAMAGYLVLLGYARWYATQDLSVPRYHQLMFLAALGLTGIALGQLVRRARRLAEVYAARLGGDWRAAP